jgi:hypothetical protein
MVARSTRAASSSPFASSSVVAAARIDVSGVRSSWVSESISAVRSRSPSRAASIRAEASIAIDRASTIATCALTAVATSRESSAGANQALPPAATPASAPS